MNARCPICGEWFYRDAPWKKTCLACWKSQQASSNLVKIDADELRDIKERAARSERRAEELFREVVRLQQQAQILPPGMKDFISDLIFLCHPDKHGGCTRANAVTAWLLDVRREVLQ